MGMTLRMAFRNIFRAKRRSLITILAMAFALGMMIIYVALYQGLLRDMQKSALTLVLGYVQIHAPEYRETPSLYKRIADPDKLVARIDSEGYTAAPRLFANGLAAFGNSSAGAQLRGVDPVLEAKATRLPHHIRLGNWLSADDPKGVVLGSKLALNLGAKIGDEIVIVSQAADGSLANDLYKVRGVLKSAGEEIDRAGFFLTLQAFRELMVLPEGAHEIVVSLPEEADLDAATARIAALAPQDEVLNWRKLNPALAEMIELSEASMIPLIVIVYIAIGIVVLNAMLMAVFERIREYGVMKALGIGPWRVFILVVLETLFMAVGASIVGVAFGAPVMALLSRYGLDLTAFGDSAAIGGVALEMVWRTAPSFEAVFTPMILLTLLALLAAVYPAWKAARLNPIDAIHHQ
ncbi:MAG: ABC transporter permease [Myxococcales bacterium]|nr:MAG: ABC transporter permease [Myxococcales bacterium]